jgi:hypothetical protein
MLEEQPASIKLCTEHDAEGCMSVDDSSVSSPVPNRDDYDIFISYSRRDKEFVSQLCEVLIQANQKIWVDWNDIPPAEDWRQEIYRGIEAANNFVFVISPHSTSSVVCGEELDYAIKHGKRLVVRAACLRKCSQFAPNSIRGCGRNCPLDKYKRLLVILQEFLNQIGSQSI